MPRGSLLLPPVSEPGTLLVLWSLVNEAIEHRAAARLYQEERSAVSFVKRGGHSADGRLENFGNQLTRQAPHRLAFAVFCYGT